MLLDTDVCKYDQEEGEEGPNVLHAQNLKV